MIFIETSIFTKEIKALLTDEQYRALQVALMRRPKAGRPIKGGGGLRKIRWPVPGEGKRGGLRIIYWVDSKDTIYMLYPYKKTDQEDLSPSQLKVLRKLVEESFS